MKMNSEQEVIERIRKGDTDSFEQLIKIYQRPLFVMIANFFPGSHRVEDMVQEIFLAAFKNIQTFNPKKSRFSTWIFRIARNRCLNERRKKREDTIPELPDTAGPDDPSKSLLEKEIFERLDQALASLHPGDRTIFILAEFEELSYKEIAEIEGIRLGTVKSRLSRSKQKLRSLLKDHDQYRFSEN